MADNKVTIVLTIDDSQMSVTTQRVNSNLKQVQTSLQQTADSTKKIDQHFNGLSGKFRDFIVVAGLLRFALYDIRDVFGVTIGKVIESSAKIERMTKLMEGLSTATSKQAKELDAVNSREFVFRMAKNAPFEVNALTDSFVKLKAAGIDPTKGGLQTLVDSVSKFGGSSETLKRASVAIQQMAGKGVISMEELRQQLGEAIPTAMRNMADGMGLSMSDLVKHISKGEVDSKTALRRMMTVMQYENEGAAAELNKTWIGQMEKLKTNFTLFTNQIGQGGFFEAITESLSDLNKYFESDSGRKFAIEIGQSLKSFIDGVTTAISFVREYGSEIKELAKALVILWGGSFAFKALSGISSFYKANRDAMRTELASQRSIQEAKLVMDRNDIASKARVYQEKIQLDIDYNNKKMALLRIGQNAEMAQSLAHNKRALAAQLSLESGLTTRGTPVNVTKATNTMSTQRELALSAQANANTFVASQRQMQVANDVATASINANAQKAAIALTAMGTTATTTVGVMKAAGIAMNLALGWVGWISIALTAGAALWTWWGDKASEAANKAKDALAETKAGMADLNTAATINAGLDADRIKLKGISNQINAVNSSDNMLYKKDELPKLAKQYQDVQKTIADGEKNVAIALKQGKENSAKSYAEDWMKGVKVDSTDTITAVKDRNAKVMNALRELNDSDKTKAKKINEEKVRAMSEGVNLEIAANNASQAKLEKNIKANFDKNGKIIDEQLARQYSYTTIALSDERTSLDDKLANRQEVGTEFKFTPKTDTKAAGAITSKIQSAIDAIRGKTAELKAEASGLDGTMARLMYDLDKTDKYTEKGKKGVRIPVSADNRAALIAAQLEKDEAEKIAQDIKDTADFISRSAGEAGQAFDSLTGAWEDGQAKYKAALDNYESDTKVGSTADAKMVASFAEKRKAIVRYYEAAGVSAENSLVALKMFDEYANKTVDNTRGAKALETAQGWKKQAEQIEISMIENASVRARTEGDKQLADLKNNYDAQMILLEGNLSAQQKLRDDYNAIRIATEKDVARKAETPMQQMGRSWRDVTTQMQNASTKWANSTIDKFMELAITGKASFTELVESVLTDILRIQMQKQMSKTLESVFGGLEEAVGGIFGGDKVDEATAQTTVAQKAGEVALKGLTTAARDASSKATDLAGSMTESAIEGIAQAANSATASGALNHVAQAATAAANALGQLATNGGVTDVTGGDSGGIFGGISDFFGGMFGGGDSYEMPPEFAFANGGIMTSAGPIELRKYANGGIANRPQAAIFGEGSMNEAYVPLPDGKTIPVTMSGGNNSQQQPPANVIVNVVNQTSQPVTAKQSQPRFDGKQMVLDIVLTAISQPGQFREGMKGALG